MKLSYNVVPFITLSTAAWCHAETEFPSVTPSGLLSNQPSTSHSSTSQPSSLPTTSSAQPTETPSELPSVFPIADNTQLFSLPSREPTVSPTIHPTTEHPTETSSRQSREPSTNTPEISSKSSSSPSASLITTLAPSTESTVSNQPSFKPTDGHTDVPSDSPSGPNLIMILTDEHNLRTLGCYREFFKRREKYNDNNEEQANVWGEGVEVETPNIDKLAAEGVLFSNFITVSPLCTPSRASFMSGLYPFRTGKSTDNHGRMDDDVVTFAEVLKTQRDYYTGYFGKWHLNGHGKPGWGNDERQFGFTSTKYQWNRGHWKFIDEVDGSMEAYEMEDSDKFSEREEKHFTTDYLFDRAIDFMDAANSRNQSFAYVLSIPDPHAPNQVRSPYNSMYQDVHFNLPKTAKAAVQKDPATPGWNYNDHSDVPLDEADKYLSSYQNGFFYQNHLQQYFGMVKCIDDNVGKLLNYLNATGLDKETIIVFTSDHGDLLGEHGKLNKGRPYRTSAGVPFIVRYPGHLRSGKMVKSATSSVDFAPTILSLMGVKSHGVHFDGADLSEELLSNSAVSNIPRVRFTFDSTVNGDWAAVIRRDIKIVVSKWTEPWLFDLKADPFEIQNYFDVPKYASIRDSLMDRLFPAIIAHGMSIANATNAFYWSTPACRDKNDRIEIDSKLFTCNDIGKDRLPFEKCSQQSLKNHCPVSCKSCCEDSQGKLWFEGNLKGCDQLKYKCGKKKVQDFCPFSCGLCTHPHTDGS